MGARADAQGTGTGLIARCQAGDRSAWRELVEAHAGLVHGLLRSRFRLADADAEDVFQEVFCRIYLRLGSLQDDTALVGWIIQVTRNAAIDHLRRRGRELPVEASEEVADVRDAYHDLHESLTVRTALARLPVDQREIIERFFVRDESYATIAEALDLPPGTIASRISRALAALRRDLEPAS